MGSYNNAYTYKLFRLLKMSGINFVSNPLVNTHLQGRFDTYPKRRGITRVKELNEAGINVSFGHDDIFDPLLMNNCKCVFVFHHILLCGCYRQTSTRWRGATSAAAYSSGRNRWGGIRRRSLPRPPPDWIPSAA